MKTPEYISGHEKVIEYYGWWPTFHDAEVRELFLNHIGPTCKMKIYVYDMYRNQDTLEWSKSDRYAVVSFQFNQIEEIELKNFNKQNVLSCIEFKKEEKGIINVSFPSIYGLDGYIRCKNIEVIGLDKLLEKKI